MSELLEVRDPHGAFERIESWLRERGFFVPGGEGLVADLYLGYGLSEALRRGTRPRPGRAVPAAACGLLRPIGPLRCRT